MPNYKDQVGRTIELNESPQRIISLVPSQTELLYDLGLGDRVVGITKFCIHPDQWYRSKERLGGTKQVHIDKIVALKPDLIICNKEENTKEIVAQCAGICPVWVTDIINLEDAFEMMQQLGLILNKESESQVLINDIKSEFEQIQLKLSKKALYLIWRAPWMAAGQDNIINALLAEIGLDNAVEIDRYPEINLADYKDVDHVFLSSEPYPFRAKHINELKEYFPLAKIQLVDGEMFSWYGSRLKYSPSYFNSLQLD